MGYNVPFSWLHTLNTCYWICALFLKCTHVQCIEQRLMCLFLCLPEAHTWLETDWMATEKKKKPWTFYVIHTAMNARTLACCYSIIFQRPPCYLLLDRIGTANKMPPPTSSTLRKYDPLSLCGSARVVSNYMAWKWKAKIDSYSGVGFEPSRKCLYSLTLCVFTWCIDFSWKIRVLYRFFIQCECRSYNIHGRPFTRRRVHGRGAASISIKSHRPTASNRILR